MRPSVGEVRELIDYDNNPFRSKVRVRVLEILNGYVKYQFVGTYSTSSLSLKQFIELYRSARL